MLYTSANANNAIYFYGLYVWASCFKSSQALKRNHLKTDHEVVIKEFWVCATQITRNIIHFVKHY